MIDSRQMAGMMIRPGGDISALDQSQFSQAEPYRAPISKMRPRPTPESIGELVTRLTSFYQVRQDRLHVLEDCWKLSHPAATESWQQVVALPDPRLMMGKIANRMGKANLEIQVDAASEQEVTEDAAQREENFYRWWLYRANEVYGEYGRGEFQFESAFMGLQRGCICNVVLADPSKPEFPYKIIPMDWANVFPTPGDDPGRPVVCLVNTVAMEIKTLFPNADVDVTSSNAKHQLVYYYDDTWMGVFLSIGTNNLSVSNLMPLKSLVRHNYGFNPIVITPVNGSPVRGSPWDDSDWARFIGVPMLDPVADWIHEFNVMLSRVYTAHAVAFDPARLIYWDKANNVVRIFNVDMTPGVDNQVPPGVEKVDFVQSKPLPPDNSFVTQMFQSRLDQLMPPNLSGQGASGSGYQAEVEIYQTQDVFFPATSALQSHLRKILWRIKHLMANPQVGLGGVMVAAQSKAYPFTPDDAALETMIHVRLVDITPSDQARMITLATQAVQAGLLSVQTAVQWSKLSEDPRGEIRRILAEMISKSPEVLKMQVVQALVRLGRLDDARSFTSLVPPPQMPGATPPAQIGAPQASQPPPMQPGSQVIPPESLGQGEASAMPTMQGQEPMPGVGAGGRGPY